jgi:hypothetical protein
LLSNKIIADERFTVREEIVWRGHSTADNFKPIKIAVGEARVTPRSAVTKVEAPALGKPGGKTFRKQSNDTQGTAVGDSPQRQRCGLSIEESTQDWD